MEGLLGAGALAADLALSGVVAMLHFLLGWFQWGWRWAHFVMGAALTVVGGRGFHPPLSPQPQPFL
jgi:hypothetical protein